ncbi:pyridine nucleotide-disulfide oxidoreductase [Neokomagataea tanensis]|uniref:Pyridine nucleotide-disulfide oxidoreductase n=1 Tax=Neokomagataea tanensis TaxID=661191 RepID=A0A4Y6V9W8_9PROT|nr:MULTISPECIES: FAD/NAD(P)-binding protein [Neokomagataea]QDH25480.1 pyridine nucleotide-disulfide oxidoreductase [Neokomagataea tanensis]
MIPVVIIGGGATGSIVALHLRSLLPDVEQVVVVEPKAELGRGLAYSTDGEEHRINVPAHKMSARSAEPLDFANWLTTHIGAAPTPNSDRYPPRLLFGKYIGGLVSPLLERGELLHLKARVTHLDGEGPFTLVMDNGATLRASKVVIATSHPPPALPRGLSAGPAVVINPWAAGAFDRIGNSDRVAIIGTGLTMADVVAQLTKRGHQGKIVAFSRRGLRSRSHANKAEETSIRFKSDTALSLLQEIRRTILGKARWQDVIDAVRKQGAEIWARLPLAEKRRLIRHLRPFWDVHRFRVAPQIDSLLDVRIANKTLEITAARLVKVTEHLRLQLQTRRQDTRFLEVDWIVNATGPDHAGLVRETGFLKDLAQRGIVAPDPTSLGLHTSRQYRAVGQEHLFIAGPLARGTFGELMGFPEITQHAEACAQAIAQTLVQGRVGP